MSAADTKALVRAIASTYPKATRIVEVGVGRRCDVARAIADALPKCTVLVTDVDPVAVMDHAGCPAVHAVVDDVARPDPWFYHGATVLYSVRPPPELVPALTALADAVGADLLVAPLSEDAPVCQGGRWTRLRPDRLVFVRPARVPMAAPVPLPARKRL